MRAADAFVGAVVRHNGAPVVIWANHPRPGRRWVSPVGRVGGCYDVAVRDLTGLRGAERVGVA